MENFKAPVPVEYSNQRVLLSKQVAECYGCSVDRIKDNFFANKKQYAEGLHYFKVTGSDLQKLRVGNPDLQISPMTRTLYLWTYQGCVRHCKSINTPEAWEVFDELEKVYFSRYSSVLTAAAESAQLKSSKRSEGQKSPAYVYVLLMSNNLVLLTKLGQSNNILARITRIERETGLTVKDIYFTPLMPRDKARLIEGLCKKKFSAQRIKGEFFSADFDEVWAAVNRFMEMAFATLPQPQVSNFARGKEILAVVNTMADSPEKQRLLIAVKKIIADEKFS